MSFRRVAYDVLTVLGAAAGRRPLCGPRIVQLNISDRCNLHCVMCNQWSVPRGRFMPYEKAKGVLEELYGLGLREVYYHGVGEPFLHPRLGDLVRAVSSGCAGLRQFVVTNGTAISPAMAEDVLRHGVRLRASIHAGDRATWARIHPRDDPALFDRMAATVKRLASADPSSVELLYVIFKTNWERIPAMIAFAEEVGVRRVLFRPMRLLPGPDGRSPMNEHLLLDRREFERSSDEIARLRAAARGRLEIGAEPFLEAVFDDGLGRPSTLDFFRDRRCFIGWLLTVILADGSVIGCLEESFERAMGSVHESRMKDIWLSKDYDLFRRRQLRLHASTAGTGGCASYCQHLGLNARLSKLLKLRIRSGGPFKPLRAGP
jgi:MoaA/NifB/PqqE/SkfB family radical SAM enzyme